MRCIVGFYYGKLVFLTVQFDVVYVPCGEGVCVGLQVTEDARIAGAGKVAVVLVDAELQTTTVNLKTIQKTLT